MRAVQSYSTYYVLVTHAFWDSIAVLIVELFYCENRVKFG